MLGSHLHSHFKFLDAFSDIFPLWYKFGKPCCGFTLYSQKRIDLLSDFFVPKIDHPTGNQAHVKIKA